MAQTPIGSKQAPDVIDEIAHRIGRERMVPELQNEAIRERFLYSYRLIYELKPDCIEMLAVIHGSRLLLDHVEHRLQVND